MSLPATPRDRAAALPCWSAAVEIESLSGGITNTNFLVRHAGERFVVRVGADIPVHGIMRFQEVAASKAAFAAGLSPEVIYDEPGALVLRFIEGKTLAAEDVRPRAMLRRIVPLLRRCHAEMPLHVRGPALIFWVFHAIRDYAATLRADKARLVGELPRLLRIADSLEQQVGAIRLVFGHNDLLPANLLDDGERLWLIDWDYGAFNSPLFDLGNLCSNNEVAPKDEAWLLEEYFDAPLGDDLRGRYAAMKCASLLREAMWSMISERYSTINFDYVAYTAENLARFEKAYDALEAG